MGIKLPDGRKESDEVLEALRLRALRGCELGFTEGDLAEILGVARETISRWWNAYCSAGDTDGLPQGRTGRPVGSGRALDDEQAAHIQQLIDQHGNPEDLGIPSPLWTRRAVRDLIKNEYGIDMAVRTVGEYLKRWGYTSKRPRRHAKQQDPDEVEEWLEETYPEIEKQAEQEDAQIHWCDEAGVAADEHPGYGYARKGQPATMEVPPPHIRVNVISTVNNEGDLHFMTYTDTLNAALFIVFLERLLQETAPRKIFLIADRLRAHQAAIVEQWLASHTDRIQLFYLPRRSPELNPDEYLNNDLKGNVHAAGLPNNKAELLSRAEAFLYHLLDWSDHVARYFQHPCVQYARRRQRLQAA
jgi:transposase